MINIDSEEIKKAKEQKEKELEEEKIEREFIDEDEVYSDELSVPNRNQITKIKIIEDFMDTWLKHEKNNRDDRKSLLTVFKWLLGGQLVLLNLVIGLKAFGYANHISENFLKWFITEVFIQILGVVFFMVKYLYNDGYDKIMRAILSLFDKTSENNKFKG